MAAKALRGQTVKPENVTTLREWVQRWPKAGNLSFDKEERNPVIYSLAAPPTKVKEIPWKREADTLTVLTQRPSFGSTAIGAAERRIGKLREDRAAIQTAAEEQLRLAEAALLDAWRIYRGAAGGAGGRDALMRDIVVAEKGLRALEAAVAGQLSAERKAVTMGEYTTVQTPAMPRALRGMPLTEVE